MARIASLYNSFIRGSGFKADPFQLSIVKKLDDFLTLCKQPKYFWSREGKKGVYLYGSVGSGKTMLMDMFHLAATKESLLTRRVHYNEFMLDIHSSNLGQPNN